MKQTILFDLDDTLIYCNRYFHRILDQFADAMTAWFQASGVPRQVILDKQTEIDIAGVQVMGFKSDHFPQSFIDTYRYFLLETGRRSSIAEEDLLWNLGQSVFELEVEPYPMMEETLEELADYGHELHLYTGGEPLIQHRKIKSMNLERYFHDRIYVRQHKNASALEEIVARNGFDRNRTWMIGNSVRTDVLPALHCGLHAIYMKRDNEWDYNVLPIDTTPLGALLTLSELLEVPPAIHGYVRQFGLKEPG